MSIPLSVRPRNYKLNVKTPASDAIGTLYVKTGKRLTYGGGFRTVFSGGNRIVTILNTISLTKLSVRGRNYKLNVRASPGQTPTTIYAYGNRLTFGGGQRTILGGSKRIAKISSR